MSAYRHLDLSRIKNTKLREITLALAWGDRHDAGFAGEALARESLTALGLEYVEVDQSKETLHPELKRAGGKRPDFILQTELDEHVVLVDAKYHDTTGRVFKLEVEEIEKFLALQRYTESLCPGAKVEVIFWVFPQRSVGNVFAAVWLDEIAAGTPCKFDDRPARAVDISSRLLDPKTGELASAEQCEEKRKA